MVIQTRVIETFQAFSEQWLIRLEIYLDNLLQLIQLNNRNGEGKHECESIELINQVMGHYNEYNSAKARVVQENVFLVLAAPWFSSLERAYLWIGGFRAGLALRLVINNVTNLTQDQSHRINVLMIEVKEEEKDISDELGRLQEGMASPAMVELARHVGRTPNGSAANMESVYERLKASMETIVDSADSLRMKTILKIREILKPAQELRFLTAAAQLQLNLHRFGLRRDNQIERRNANLPNSRNMIF